MTGRSEAARRLDDAAPPGRGAPASSVPPGVKGSGAAEGFQFERFEYIPAAESVVLVRVVGRWSMASLAGVRLTAHGPGGHQDFAPLSGGGDAARHGSHGIAFAVPPSFVEEREIRFSLRLRPGRFVDLGVPTRRELESRHGSPRRPGGARHERLGGSAPLSKERAAELSRVRAQLQSMNAECVQLEHRVTELRQAIRARVGLADRPFSARRTKREEEEDDARLLARLGEQIAAGSRRVAALEARVAKLAHQLRSGELARGPAGAFGRSGPRE